MIDALRVAATEGLGGGTIVPMPTEPLTASVVRPPPRKLRPELLSPAGDQVRRPVSIAIDVPGQQDLFVDGTITVVIDLNAGFHRIRVDVDIGVITVGGMGHVALRSVACGHGPILGSKPIAVGIREVH